MAPSILEDLNVSGTEFKPLPKKKELPLILPSFLPALPDESGVTKVQDVDIGTPDNWIKRDERIIRLTGKVGSALPL